MGVLYKNAPLVNTAFELRFFGDLSIETRRDQFQKAVKAEFPKLWVPNAAPNTSPALQHYQFRSEDNSARVSLAVNSFVYATSTYPGFEKFRENLERQRVIFDRVFGIESYTRLGLRYTNKLPILRDEQNTIPLGNYVTLQVGLGRGFSGSGINDLGLSIASKIGNGDLRLIVQREEQNGLEVLTLDLDYSLQGNIEKKKIPDFLTEAHQHIESVFLGLISDDYKAIMEGE